MRHERRRQHFFSWQKISSSNRISLGTAEQKTGLVVLSAVRKWREWGTVERSPAVPYNHYLTNLATITLCDKGEEENFKIVPWDGPDLMKIILA